MSPPPAHASRLVRSDGAPSGAPFFAQWHCWVPESAVAPAVVTNFQS